MPVIRRQVSRLHGLCGAGLALLACLAGCGEKVMPAADTTAVAPTPAKPKRPSEPSSDHLWTSPSGLEFAKIPAGRFTMGSPAQEAGRGDSEVQVEVSISRSFWMARTELTRAFVARLRGEKPPSEKAFSPLDKAKDHLPATDLTYFDALEICNLMSEADRRPVAYALRAVERGPEGQILKAEVDFAGLDSRGYRLPTEAEWEYACRAGSETANPWGDVLEPEHAAFSKSDGKLSAVRSYYPNAWGLFDMLGNASEFCWDAYGTAKVRTAVDPLGFGIRKGGREMLVVVRGGSAGDPASRCRSASRDGAWAGYGGPMGLRPVFSILHEGIPETLLPPPPEETPPPTPPAAPDNQAVFTRLFDENPELKMRGKTALYSIAPEFLARGALTLFKTGVAPGDTLLIDFDDQGRILDFKNQSGKR